MSRVCPLFSLHGFKTILAALFVRRLIQTEVPPTLIAATRSGLLPAMLFVLPLVVTEFPFAFPP